MTHVFGQLFTDTPAPHLSIGTPERAREVLEGTTFYYTEAGWQRLWPTIRKYLKESCRYGIDVRVVHLSEDHGQRVIWHDEIQVAVA
jgi:hypothetical protein